MYPASAFEILRRRSNRGVLTSGDADGTGEVILAQARGVHSQPTNVTPFMRELWRLWFTRLAHGKFIR